MAGYFVANYTINNQADYKQYLAEVGPILQAHGAEVVVVDRDSTLLEGSAGEVTVVLGPNGVLYGTGSYSGVANASGVVFQLTPPAQSGGAWTETVLHTFPAFKGDGTTPDSTMTIDANALSFSSSTGYTRTSVISIAQALLPLPSTVLRPCREHLETGPTVLDGPLRPREPDIQTLAAQV